MIWFMYSLLLFLGVEHTFVTLAETKSKSNVHIIYMGGRQNDDTDLLTKTHHQMLGSVLGSKEAVADSMIYSYKHGFSGFAAKLTDSQAKRLSELPDVVRVIPNQLYKLHTTRSYDYLDLSPDSRTNLLHDTNMGDGIIIGILDTGIWPESQSFSDQGLGPIPSRWKGFCDSGDSFDAKKHCNKKIIGARFFVKGLEAELGEHKLNTTLHNEFYSPRDSNGHGTHTSATAAGSFVPDASFNGILAKGTARGGAPRARLAMYKTCWNPNGICTSADLMKAYDEAIHDGVDVLSLSLGQDVPLFADIDERDKTPLSAFHAVERGISVVCSAGNSGPVAQTVGNTQPWVLTVAASSIDRSYPTPIMLGNNQTLVGQAIFTGKDKGFRSLMHPEQSETAVPVYCEDLLSFNISVAGKVVLCFTLDVTQVSLQIAEIAVQMAGGVGIIVARNPSNIYFTCTKQEFPCIEVSYEIGTRILQYIRTTSNPQAKLMPTKSYVGKPVSTNVAYFSSRGPNSLAPAILKPDIAAPGVKILAAVPPRENRQGDFALYSGTSMAAPHVTGIVAMLKSLHPDWSPSAIKSAIITTAWTTDPWGEPIYAEGNPKKPADPFDFGGGLVNPNKARQPGLVYDMGTQDYIYYLCAMGYNDTSINKFMKHTCPKTASILDVNLPSITVPSLNSSVTLTRTVTNVGPINSEYRALIESPQGILIDVNPSILIFDSKVKKISFTAKIGTSHQANTEFVFGSLTWTDGDHFVRIPISVQTEIAY